MPFGVCSQRTCLPGEQAPIAVGRFAGGVGRQGAAPLDHHAQAAEAEDLDLDRGVGDHLFDLGQGQHPRQHRAGDAEVLVVEVDGVVAGGRALHRQVQAQVRVGLAGVGHQARVGQDDRVDTEVGGPVDGAGPALPVVGLRVGVEGQQHLAAAVVGVAHALGHGLVVEVEAAEVAGVGGVLETEIDAVGAVVDGGLEGGQAAGGADQFDGAGRSHGQQAAEMTRADYRRGHPG
jgi:hypothetical protein